MAAVSHVSRPADRNAACQHSAAGAQRVRVVVDAQPVRLDGSAAYDDRRTIYTHRRNQGSGNDPTRSINADPRYAWHVSSD